MEMKALDHRRLTSEPEVHGLPRRDMVSPEVFELEIERLFRPSWIFAGHLSQVASPRQFITVHWRNESAVIIRTDEGELVAHHNVCRHRGFRLLEERAGEVRAALTCPYHGWCYEQSGELRSATRMPDGSLDPKTWGLKPVWLEVWNGLVFVSFAESEPESMYESLKGFDLSQYSLESAKVVKEANRELQANWKIVADNVNECYHCSLHHPEMSQIVDVNSLDAEPEVIVAPGGSLILDSPMKGDSVSLTRTGQFASKRLLGSPGEPASFPSILGVFPSLLAFCYPDHISILHFTPLAVDRTLLQNMWLVNGAAVEGEDFDPDAVTEMQILATEQDQPLIERSWRGVQSSAYQPGPYHPELEPTLHEFTVWYTERDARLE